MIEEATRPPFDVRFYNFDGGANTVVVGVDPRGFLVGSCTRSGAVYSLRASFPKPGSKNK